MRSLNEANEEALYYLNEIGVSFEEKSCNEIKYIIPKSFVQSIQKNLRYHQLDYLLLSAYSRMKMCVGGMQFAPTPTAYFSPNKNIILTVSGPLILGAFLIERLLIE